MRKLLILTSLMFLTTAIVHAAIPDMKFRRLDTRDGLSNSQVNCILQDSRGFVWIGTAYGLNRYDGYRVKTYYSDQRDTMTLRNNYVDAVFEAADGRLWVKQGMSYSLFDPVTERCDRHPERWLEQVGVMGGVEALFVDSQKDFWVKTYANGLWHYRPATGQLKQFPTGYGPQELNGDFGVSSFAEQGGTVFLCSNNGEVVCIDRKRDVILHKIDYLRKADLVRAQECKLRVDTWGNLWLLTTQSTYVYEPYRQQWHYSCQEFLQSKGLENLPEEMAVWDVRQDSVQRLWIATDHGGLYVADLAGRDLRCFTSDKRDETSVSDNTIRNLYCDPSGRMWIGTYQNGANLFVGNTTSFRNLELGNVNTVCYDRQGRTWLGTNDAGIICYNDKTDEKLFFSKATHGLGSNTMVSSLVARDGSVWFGTYEGGLIHIKDGQLTNYRATGDTLGLVSNNVWSLCEDQWGNIWLGTLGGGVQRIDRQTGRMTTLRVSNSKLQSNYIMSVSRTKKGWLLVAHSKFVSLINPKTMRVVNYDFSNNRDNVPVTENSIMAMEDSRGLIWQGTTSGATVFDQQDGHVYLIDMRSGLYGSTVTGVIEDKRHTMWLVTDHGISNVIPQRQEDGRYTFIVRSYNSREGLQNGPYNQRSICYSSAGLILVGGQGGLDIVNPDNLSKERKREAPVFSGLQLFDQDVVVGEEVDGRIILDEALDHCRQLTLRYNDQFTVQLASTSGEIHNRTRFVYRLKGFNDNWVKTSELNPNVSYMSLPPGSYTLCVRMLNDDGTIGDAESRIDITIRPPFYRSWWAILFYIVAGITALYLWVRRTVRRHAERAELERLRRELEKQQWMSEMRLQMVHDGQLKADALGDTTEEPPLEFHPDMEELVSFVRQAVDSFQMPEEKQCRLSFHSSLNRLTMSFDPELMRQLLDILMANAVRFSPAGSRIRVNVRTDGAMAELRVADHGLGIPEEARAHMFDAAVDPGIRLDIVKQIVDLHGGTVRAEDNFGGGTVFIMLLPTEGSQAGASGAQPTEETGGDGQPASSPDSTNL